MVKSSNVGEFAKMIDSLDLISTSSSLPGTKRLTPTESALAIGSTRECEEKRPSSSVTNQACGFLSQRSRLVTRCTSTNDGGRARRGLLSTPLSSSSNMGVSLIYEWKLWTMRCSQEHNPFPLRRNSSLELIPKPMLLAPSIFGLVGLLSATLLLLLLPDLHIAETSLIV